MQSFAVLAFAAAAVLPAQELHLVHDANRQLDIFPLPAEFRHVELDGWLYIARDVAGLGPELHRLPVAGGSTELVADIAPGPAGSWPDRLTVMGGALYFQASDGVHGRELWTSDGTAAGTQMVADLRPGIGDGLVADVARRAPFAVAGGALWFAADDGVSIGAWRSDGTAAGTFQVVADEPWLSSPETFTKFQGDLFFAGRAGSSSNSPLWRIDPVTLVATPVFTFYASFGALTVMGGELFMNAHTNFMVGTELWKSDGTSIGTQQVKDINPSQLSAPGLFTVVGDTLYFYANDGPHNHELWKSDGTEAGTVLVKDIAVGSDWSSVPTTTHRMVALGDTLLFYADDNQSETLWRSDGTEAGTVPVATGLNAPEVAWYRDLEQAGVSGGVLYFGGGDAAAGTELWRSDGTAAGTWRVADLLPGPESSSPRGFVAEAAGTLRFVADGPAGPTLWRTGGTASTTVALTTAVHTSLPETAPATPLGPVDLFGRLIYTAYEAGFGYEPWATDGSAAGSVRLGDLTAGPSSSIYTGDWEVQYTVGLPAVPVGHRLFFAGMDGFQRTLFVTDGTVAGTHTVKAIAGISGASTAHMPGVALKGRLYFGGWKDGIWGLWTSAGIAATTGPLVQSAGGSVEPLVIGRVANEVFFVGYDSLHGLWKTDGTTGGEALVHAPDAVEQVFAVRDTLYYRAVDAASGAELWRTDGTPAGTFQVVDLRPGPLGSDPELLARFGDLLVFAADDGSSGRELWTTDGTAAGTALFVDANPGPGHGAPTEVTVVGDRVYFVASPSPNVGQLWVADSAGAQLLETFTPGSPDTSPTASGKGPELNQLTAVGTRKVYFEGVGTASQHGESFGRELWVSDGTAAGTRMLGDHTPTKTGAIYEFGSEIAALAVANGRLFASAHDVRAGRELHALFPGATATVVGEGCSGSGLPPELRATDPVLGGSSELSIANGEPLAASALYLSIAGLGALDLTGGCYAHVDLATAVSIAVFATDSSGAWSLPAAIPADVTLAGLPLMIQALVGTPYGPTSGSGVSNGVLLVLGD